MKRPSFRALSAIEQLTRTDEWVNDPRGVIPSGFAEVDERLARGGFHPTNLVLIGGRTGTRKTTVALNMVSNMLRAGRNVGFVTLDEATSGYTLKLMSVMYDIDHMHLASIWNEEAGKKYQERFKQDAAKYSVSHGYRPSVEALDTWLSEAGDVAARPDVVFLDYVSILDKGQYGSATDKVVNTIEELQVWAREREIVVIALHQVGRFESGGSNRDEGQMPMSASRLKHAGEEIADIVFGTYRPALDPIGNTDTYGEAKAIDRDLEYDQWQEAVDRVKRNEKNTYLQLLKNRPGEQPDKTARKGFKLTSEGTMRVRGRV